MQKKALKAVREKKKLDWGDLKASALQAYEKMNPKKGAFDVLQKKRTGTYGTDLKETMGKGLTGMFQEDEISDIDSFSEGSSYDFSS